MILQCTKCEWTEFAGRTFEDRLEGRCRFAPDCDGQMLLVGQPSPIDGCVAPDLPAEPVTEPVSESENTFFDLSLTIGHRVIKIESVGYSPEQLPAILSAGIVLLTRERDRLERLNG